MSPCTPKSTSLVTLLLVRSYWHVTSSPRSLLVTILSWCWITTSFTYLQTVLVSIDDTKFVSLPLLSQPVFPHVALQVVVGHAQLELQTVVDVLDARVRTALGVDFAVEKFAGLDASDHVPGSTVDAYVVAGAELVGRGLRNFQIGILTIILSSFTVAFCLVTYLNIGEGSSRMVA